MSDRTEVLLAELLEVQRRVLANQETALDTQRLALARQQRALRWVFALVGLVTAAVLLPYGWQWFAYLAAR